MDASGSATDHLARLGGEARKIGHDLNNCLGIVGGRAELLKMYLDRGDVDGAGKGVDAILGQMERMRELTDALRTLEDRVRGATGG